MPRLCDIIVYYHDGKQEDYYGVLYVDDKLLRIYPAAGGKTINIPLLSIRKYITHNTEV